MSAPAPNTAQIIAARPGERQWWRDAVVYQLYLRSFADGDGDGIGDLVGVAEHVDYIDSLGVDAIWLNPCYPSPNNDGGYDIADYTDIDATYGGIAAFEKVLTAAHERGMRVLMDLVPNHCSEQHPWFQRALTAAPGSPERARFLFRDGRGRNGDEPPNNWLSTFGGPAWTRVPNPDGSPGQWYLHSFDATQPDFDWTNPEVADMFDDVLRFWFDKGVDGFRIDVAYAMVKADGLPDAPDPLSNGHTWNQPGVHQIFPRWRAVAASYDRDAPLVGEVWLPPAQAAEYIGPSRLDGVFFFDLMQQGWDADGFRASIDETLRNIPVGGGGVPAWTLNNHDVHRAVSRYGLVEPEPIRTHDLNALRTRGRGRIDVGLGLNRARAAALLLLALPGSSYLYQGEELGLPEVLDLPDEVRRDPIWFRSLGQEHGRDGSRVPLPWRTDARNFGFSVNPDATTWLPQPDWFADFAVDRQDRVGGSTLELYRSALRLRRSLFTGPLEWLDAGRPDVLAFRRGVGIAVTCFGPEHFIVPEEWGRPRLTSEDPRRPNSSARSTWLAQ